MRLLVTRPEPEAARTAARLRALGHDPVVQPLLAVELLPPPAAPIEPAVLAVTSRNALRALARWPDLSRWLGLPLYAVGEQTGAAARALGFADVRTGAGDGGDLARLMMAGFAADAGPILYPAAEERASGLEAALREGGYDIRTVVAYRMHPVSGLDEPVRAELAAGGIGGVLLYSRRTAAVFRDLVIAAGLRAALGGTTLYVLSGAVAAAVRHLAPGAIRVAPSPDEEALLALLPLGQ
jgi:uroporphyrinogen-III synthase